VFKARASGAFHSSVKTPLPNQTTLKSKESPLDVKGVKLGMSTAELVAIVREGERG